MILGHSKVRSLGRVPSPIQFREGWDHGPRFSAILQQRSSKTTDFFSYRAMKKLSFYPSVPWQKLHFFVIQNILHEIAPFRINTENSLTHALSQNQIDSFIIWFWPLLNSEQNSHFHPLHQRRKDNFEKTWYWSSSFSRLKINMTLLCFVFLKNWISGATNLRPSLDLRSVIFAT